MASNSSKTGVGWRPLQWWPSVAGIAFAAFVASDLFRERETGVDLAPIVTASGLVYLAAAALDKPAIAWPAFFLTVLVITAAKFGVLGVDATWILLGIAALLFALGLIRSQRQPRTGLPLQAIAMLVFGSIAGAALFVNQVVGAYLVAAGLFLHAAWDAYHHWTEKVVVRSMAEFCFVLDTLLALAIVIVTLRT
jgi:hypothetical protein